MNFRMQHSAYAVMLSGIVMLLTVVFGLEKVSCADQITATLIPIKVGTAFDLCSRFTPAPPMQFPPVSKVDQDAAGFGQISYYFSTKEGIAFDVNAMTGDMNVDYPRNDEHPNSQSSLTEKALLEEARKHLNRLYPDPTGLTGELGEPLATHVVKGQKKQKSATVKYYCRESLGNGVVTLNRCIIGLARDDGRILSYMGIHRKNTVLTTPTYSRADALAIAKWAPWAGKPVAIETLLFSEFNTKQKQAWDKGFQSSMGDDGTLKIEEDAWLHQRLLWTFGLNIGSVKLDAHTGQLTSFDSWPLDPDDLNFAPFKLSRPQQPPTPKRLPLPQTRLETATVNFNGEEIYDPENGFNDLHYPPIVQNNAPLIYDSYFPQFLISVVKKGNDIALQGQLKDTGKGAALKIGDKVAVVEGKRVKLSVAPTMIDGRLYLPAELLQLVNGIPIRWEANRKMLWVETRYLRR